MDRLTEAKRIGTHSWEENQTRYTIKDAIAVGGMGAILRARDHKARRDVAMKVMLQAEMNSPAANRFIREARIVANLEHPNIVPVHEIGTSPKDEPYFTMKWVQGENLADILFKLSKGDVRYRRKYTLPTLLEIFIQVCNGVAFAHSKGVIHLDLKPHNILVGDYGEVLVLDWGLATRLKHNNPDNNSHAEESVEISQKHMPNASPASQHVVTEDGIIKGTPGFMAPEQAQGEIAEIDERSDIFSLGSILYMMLTLKFPIVGENPSEILQHTIDGNFVPPGKRIYHKAVPKELEAIVMKAMALKKADRYNSVEGFQADVFAYSRGYATSLEEGGFLKSAALLLRRRRGEFFLLALSAVAVVALLFVIMTIKIRLDLQVNRTRTANVLDDFTYKRVLPAFRTNARTSFVFAEEARRELDKERGSRDFHAYVANIRLVDLSIRHSRYDRTQTVLEKCPASFRHWEWGRLKYLTELGSPALQHPKSFTAVCTNRDGTMVAFSDTDHVLTVRNLITNEIQELRGSKESRITAIAMSDDSSKLTVGGVGTTVELWDLEIEEPIRLYLGHSEPISSLDFSGDGATIAAGCQDGTILMWNVKSGNLDLTIKAHDGTVSALALNDDGNMLVSAGVDGTVTIWNCEDETPIKSLSEHSGAVTAMAFHEQSMQVVTGGRDKTVIIWDANTDDKFRRLKPEINEILSVAISNDTQSILAGGAGFIAGIWDAQTGQTKRLLRGHTGPITSVAFIGNGKEVVTASDDRTLKIWLVDGDFEYHALAGNETEVYAAAVSSDGKYVAAASADQTIRVWSVDDGQEVYNLDGYTGGLNGLCFGHDNEDLIAAGADSSIKIWKFKAARERLILEGHSGPINSISISEDGRTIITAGQDRTARIWNTVNGHQNVILSGRESPVVAAALSSQGHIAATAGEDHSVRLWNTEIGTPYKSLVLEQTATALAISPDGSALLVGNADGKVSLFECEGPGTETIRSLEGHLGKINSICVSNDNKRVFTGSLDTTVKVWDLSTGTELTTLRAHKGSVNSVAITSDNRRIITGGADAQVIIWDTADWTEQSDEDGSRLP